LQYETKTVISTQFS